MPIRPDAKDQRPRKANGRSSETRDHQRYLRTSTEAGLLCIRGQKHREIKKLLLLVREVEKTIPD